MSTDSTNAMRDVMLLVAAYAADGEAAAIPPAVPSEPLNEACADASTQSRLLVESRDLIFKLRAHTETSATSEADSDEHALGVEQGFARAADMIENLLRRYEKG